MKTNNTKFTQIIEAAVTVIAQNGYHNSQVAKIAKQAGVADGTIYLYFKNKEDILVSLFEEKMGDFIEKIEEAIKAEQDPIEKLRILIHMHFQQLASDHQMATVTQLELRQSNKNLRSKINKVLKRYFTIIDEIIIQGIEQQLLVSSINKKLVRQMIFGTIDETVTNWVMKEQKYDLAKQADEVHALLVDGLYTRR